MHCCAPESEDRPVRPEVCFSHCSAQPQSRAPGAREGRVRVRKDRSESYSGKVTGVSLGLRRVPWEGDKFPPDWHLGVPRITCVLLPSWPEALRGIQLQATSFSAQSKSAHAWLPGGGCGSASGLQPLRFELLLSACSL